MNLTQKTQKLITDHFQNQPLTLAVDATCGNGNDSLFLCRHAEQVLCFDVQTQAIENTKALLTENDFTDKSSVIHRGHEYLNEELNARNLAGKIDAAMFNFGYLPKSDDLSITTTRVSSLQAVKQTLDNLSDNGIISLLCYRGHKGGPEEHAELDSLIKGLDSKEWRVQQYDSFNPTEATPLLLFISKHQVLSAPS